jgi:hypothetical protein
VPSFRVTYHTTGGPFSRTVEAESVEAAEKAALGALEETLIAFAEKDTRFTLKSAEVAAVSVEEERAATSSGERRTAGFTR